jgi:hypothetical protein
MVVKSHLSFFCLCFNKERDFVSKIFLQIGLISLLNGSEIGYNALTTFFPALGAFPMCALVQCFVFVECAGLESFYFFIFILIVEILKFLIVFS